MKWNEASAAVLLLLAMGACSADSTEGTTQLGVSAPVAGGASGVTGAVAGRNAGSTVAPTTAGASGMTASGVMTPVKPAGTAAAPAPAPAPAPTTTPGRGTAGVGTMAGASGAAAPPPVMLGPGQTLPPVTDYTKPGPFNPTMEVDNTGPDGMYTVFKPTNLDTMGFKFVPLTWGNGVTTTPQVYPILLSTVASHGFVVVASNSSSVTSDMLTAGLDWLIQQNDVAGPYQGKLDVTRAVAMGYSLGGGAALTAGNHPKVIATIGMHPAPGNSGGLHGPLLLFTGDADVVVAPTLVDLSFASSSVPTFYVSLAGATHFEPVGGGGQELAPCIAWLRLFVFHDDGAKPFFFGADCTMCKAPWTAQNKMWPPPGF